LDGIASRLDDLTPLDAPDRYVAHANFEVCAAQASHILIGVNFDDVYLHSC